MHQPWTRRDILVAGLGLFLTGCTRRGAEPALAPRSTAIPRSLPATEARATFRYVVERGDTLSSIGRRSGLTVGEIVRANGLRSHLIRPGQALRLPGVHDLHADPLAHVRNQLAQPGTGGYELVPRRRWTRNAIRNNHRPMKGVSRITVHHTGEHKGMVGKSDVEIVKMIEHYHRDVRKWSSIGYHYLVGRDGRIYEGRPNDIQGAHTSGHNRHNLGISVIGDFQVRDPTRRQLIALGHFLDDTRHRHAVPRARVYGHRDLSPSICPGDRLHRWVQSYRRG